FASAATFYETTGIPTVVAFDAGNLKAVAETLRQLNPGSAIVFAADNDHHLPRRELPMANIGLEKANEAARAVNGRVVAPRFLADDAGTDWNDWKAQHGARATYHELNKALTEVGVQTSAQKRARRRGPTL